MSAERAQELMKAYISEREVIHQLALDDRGNVTRMDLEEYRHTVIQAWRHWLAD